jgi:hypothetical protein
MSTPSTLFTTITFSTVGHSCSAVSAFALSGTDLPPLTPLSAVIRREAWQSCILSLNACELKPPNTML